jgi:homogentisate 1,2-dioxygenase
MNTATVDHPDPSIFCLLTSPSDAVLGPNLEIMALPPRWMVSENSFRPPGFHRNAICEFVALLKGGYLGLEPGSATLTNNWTAHGPETEAVEIFREGEQPPMKVEDQLLVLFESRFPIQITHFAASVLPTIDDYRQQWNGFKKRFAK